MIKFLIIIDASIEPHSLHYTEIVSALLRQKDTYKESEVNIEYEFIHQDLSIAPWIGDQVSHSWLGEQTRQLKPNTAYSVVYVFAGDNWKAENKNIGGWHLGNYNGYQVQLIRSNQSTDWLYRTFLMESMHSWDSPIREKLGIDLSTYCGVADYDTTLVHGIFHQGYILSQADSIRIFGEEYIKYDYSLLIKKIAPLLNKIFTMYKHVIFGKEQYIRNSIGVDYHIANSKTLKGLKEADIISLEPPLIVNEINDSGLEFLCFEKE